MSKNGSYVAIGVGFIVSAGLALVLYVLYLTISSMVPDHDLFLAMLILVWAFVSAGFVMVGYGSAGDR